MRNKIIAGNWKMNLNLEQAQSLASEIVHMYEAETKRTVQVILAPPFPFLIPVYHLVKHNSQFSIAGQNLHQEEKGAFTGETSSEMLNSAGCSQVLIGHSERRQYFGETDAIVAAKINRALRSQIIPLVCVGESAQDRETGNTFQLIEKQISQGCFHFSADEFSKLILAYEPVWAIGTGKTATPEQAQEVHAFIRNLVAKKYGENISSACRILYGGSVTASNSHFLFSQPDIDGALVGGASLKSREFLEIIKQGE